MALQKSISIKNKLFSDYINKKDLSQKTELHIKYKSYRNMLSTLMKKSKQNYFTKFFENNLKNLKNTWKGIKSIISMKISFSNSPTLLTFQNENTDNPERIANIFFLLLIQNSKYLVSSSNPERIVNIFFLPERIANIF